MAATVPPSPRRLRAARRAGLRPRSPALGLAGLAITAGLVLDSHGPRAAAWMRRALTQAITGEMPGIPIDPAVGAGLLLGLALVLGAGALLVADRRRSRRRLGVDPEIGELGEIPPWLAALSRVLALTALAAWLTPVIATAARSVDAGPTALWIVWTRWLGAGLLALATVAAVLAVIERLASARRLWQGLHLTRAQARDQARAAGEHHRR